MKNTTLISVQIMEALKLIQEQVPEAVIGGSIALNAIGLLGRPSKDIDIFVPDVSIRDSEVIRIMSAADNGEDFTSERVTDMYGKLIQKIGTKINGVPVCIFKVEDQWLEHSVFAINGMKLKIQNVNYAIAAKIAYQNENAKHKIDLGSIDDILKRVFPPIEPVFYTERQPTPAEPQRREIDADDLPF